MRPIAFTSRSLNAAKCRYSHLDKEGLAIVYGVKTFHQYLFGCKFINSDHKPLRHIFDESKLIPTMASARLQCWALTLSVYDYTIEYKPRAQNGNADLFSHLPLPEAPT